MENLSGSMTLPALMQAFTLETQAIQKYMWFAKIASKEGFEQIAAIFIETSEQKKSHAKTLFRYMEGCNVEINVNLLAEPLADTLTNLKSALLAETAQQETLFAEFEQIAWNENFKSIATKIKLFRQIKKFYADRFSKLASNIETGQVFRKDKKVKWICRKCGLIYESDRALKNCPGCEHPQAYFEILAENY